MRRSSWSWHLGATAEVEPFSEECWKFVSGYDEIIHRRLEESTVSYEIDEGLF